MRIKSAALLIALSGCASFRTNAILPLQFSQMPPRAFMRAVCNGQQFTTQGVFVCEERQPSTAQVSVKVPPLKGRIVYSNGQLKRTDDFNWYPKEGFWIFKKQPMKDTWAALDLGDIDATYGDWPVALDITAVSSVGVINTRGIIYHHVCDGADIPCSSLAVAYDCSGIAKVTRAGEIGKCVRLAGSPQAFQVPLPADPSFLPSQGGTLYVAMPRSGYQASIAMGAPEVQAGFVKLETPTVLSGPSLIVFRLVWYSAGTRHAEETRVLIVGADPSWTGLDKPHYIADSDGVKWIRPTLADLMEVDAPGEKRYGTDESYQTALPSDGGDSCAFAWQRESSDLTADCLDAKLAEEPVK